jgi:hypothetical protein
VQRLGEEIAPGQSLFQAILLYLEESGSVSRQKLIERFASKDEVVVMAVVNDLVSSGLVYRSGRGPRSVVGLVPDADLDRLARSDEGGALEDFVWLAVFKEPGMPSSQMDESSVSSEREKWCSNPVPSWFPSEPPGAGRLRCSTISRPSPRRS